MNNLNLYNSDECPTVLTVTELSQVLRLGINGTYNLLRTGEIQSIRVGRQYRVSRRAVLEYLNQQKNWHLQMFLYDRNVPCSEVRSQLAFLYSLWVEKAIFIQIFCIFPLPRKITSSRVTVLCPLFTLKCLRIMDVPRSAFQLGFFWKTTFSIADNEICIKYTKKRIFL